MKYLTIISLLLIAVSCKTPQDLFDSGMKKINKAIQLDPELKLPTDTIIDKQIEIIPGKDGKDSIIRETITKEIPCDFTLEDLKDLQSRSRRELRHARKLYNDSLNHQEKMYKLATKRKDDSLSYLKQENRQLTKQIKDTNQKEERIVKYENKCSWWLRTLGRFWYIFLIIGFLAGLYLKNLINNMLPFLFKRKTDENRTG